jgi:hypothetical protein
MTGQDRQIHAGYGALPVPKLSPELLRLVRTGQVYDLSYPISAATPYATTTSPFAIKKYQRHTDSPSGGIFGEATEILSMSSHTATDIEALCHISEKVEGRPVFYGDIPADEVEGEAGFKELGVEQCPPHPHQGTRPRYPS